MPVDARAIGTLRVQFRIVQPPAGLINQPRVDRARPVRQRLASQRPRQQVARPRAAVLITHSGEWTWFPSYNLVDEHHLVTALGKGVYTVDRLLIDVHPLQVVYDGGVTATDGMALPFGCRITSGNSWPLRPPEQARLRSACKTTALYASLDLGERVKGILEDHVDKDSQSPDVLFNRKTLTDKRRRHQYSRY